MNDEPPDWIDAEEVRQQLAQRGYSLHQPLTNACCEVWRREGSGKMCTFAYSRPGAIGRFDRRAVELTLQQIDKG
jgi:hypothetical protein